MPYEDIKRRRTRKIFRKGCLTEKWWGKVRVEKSLDRDHPL